MHLIQEFTNTSGRLVPSDRLPIKSIEKLPLPYTGSKKKLAHSINTALVRNNIQFDSILDVFSGSASVSLMFKMMGKKVIANDLLTCSYLNAVSFVENEGIKLTDGEQEYLLHNQNRNKGSFVEDNYLGTGFRDIGRTCRFNKFTRNECKHLDNFRANVDDLNSFEAQALSLIANQSVVMRLPFGNVDASLDILKHRKRQESTYGKRSDRHDRRIGIYYDDNYDLNFSKWFPKYANDFAVCVPANTNPVVPGHRTLLENIGHRRHLGFGAPDGSTKKYFSSNMDATELLKNGCNVDCIYFDPPYAGTVGSSNYASLYRFFEEYIYSKPLEEMSHITQSSYKFTQKKDYEKNFLEMLDAANNIPIWLFSYNDKSWATIDDICKSIRQFRSVKAELLNDDYRYKYQEKRTGKTSEYLIIATNE